MRSLQFCISDLPVIQIQMSRYRLIILWMLRSTDIESVCPRDELFQIEVTDFKKDLCLQSSSKR